MERIERHASFGGWQDVYQHESSSLGCTMKFGVYLPPQASSGPVPVLYWLSGLTCTEQNFITKSAVQQLAAEHGIAIVAPIQVRAESPSRMIQLTISAKVRGSTSMPPRHRGPTTTACMTTL